MSTADTPASATTTDTDPRLLKIDRWVENTSEYFNPILVKETRQALKSRQFAVTFALVLVTSWLWSVFAIFINYPQILYASAGPLLLVGYLDILLFPLAVIIPFSAFRSLAAEREDGTFELLSISTLNPRQIIWGKLISAIVQMMVYFSAIAPCIAFTYLLRGIDIITIGYALTVVFLLSVVLSASGLMLACVSRKRQWQSALSVIVIILYLIAFISALTACYGLILESTEWREYNHPDFWMATLMLWSYSFSMLFLLIELAAAQITFESENRSAGVRRMLLIQHFVILGWMIYWCLRAPQANFILETCVMLLCLTWGIAGIFMNGESTVLSPRIKRSIPLSAVERVWTNWMLPGPGRGYLFVMTCLFNVGIVSIFVLFINSLQGLSYSDFMKSTRYTYGMLLYPACYLGLGRVMVALISKYFRVDIYLSAFLHFFLLLGGMMLPLLFQIMTRNGYSNFPHITNPMWFYFRGSSRGTFLLSDEVTLVLILGSVGMAFFFLVNLGISSKELVPQRETNTKYLPDQAVDIPQTIEDDADPLA
ncbi:hypothetical protein AB1L30_24365 [Bremerella sp. JC817]|uniref:ABC transporter permease n=1 Tax=Bremerella sp. JC817 TaxID=3231756 RepID=UPI003457964B